MLAGENELTKYASSPPVQRSFCRVCGSQLFYWHEQMPGRVYLPAPCLDTLDRPIGSQVSYEEHVPWLEGIERVPCFRGQSEKDEDQLDWQTG